MRWLIPFVALIWIIPIFSAAGELPRAEPQQVGLSAERLTKLTTDLKKLVDDGKISGGVALIARHGKVAYVTAFGYQDVAKKTPMAEDTIFAIASMTKPITCVAVMTLVEQGKLGLDDPIGKHLPELKDLRVLGDSKDDTDTTIATVAAERSVTVRDLLSHSSGFAYGGFMASDTRLARAYTKAGVEGRPHETIAEQVVRLGNVPLAHQPGAGWTYGLSHDVLGRLIEVISGKTFDVYLQERVFDPLDMHDTSFYVPASKQMRVATIYRADGGGALITLPKGFGSKTFFSGGGGLYSTGRDYMRFAQMLNQGGEIDGARILKPETIALMTTNQIGKHSAFAVMKYGLGFGLIFTPDKPAGKPALSRYLWGGFFSTNFWVDPRHDLVAVIMTQILPTNHGGSDTVFRTAVDQAIR
jgi:CubicO group peptidase (beta-lactamase class C family)